MSSDKQQSFEDDACVCLCIYKLLCDDERAQTTYERFAPRFSYEYDIRLIFGANVKNSQKKARAKQNIDYLRPLNNLN